MREPHSQSVLCSEARKIFGIPTQLIYSLLPQFRPLSAALAAYKTSLFTVDRLHSYAQSRWQWLEAISRKEGVVDLIQGRIDEKTRKRKNYLKSCDDCWLLIVADSFRASGSFEFDDTCRAHVFESPFSRTYFMDFGWGKRPASESRRALVTEDFAIALTN